MAESFDGPDEQTVYHGELVEIQDGEFTSAPPLSAAEGVALQYAVQNQRPDLVRGLPGEEDLKSAVILQIESARAGGKQAFQQVQQTS